MLDRFASADPIAREAQFQISAGRRQTNFPAPATVVAGEMLTTAIVFGMIGVAAGFTWDYVIARDPDDPTTIR